MPTMHHIGRARGGHCEPLFTRGCIWGSLIGDDVFSTPISPPTKQVSQIFPPSILSLRAAQSTSYMGEAANGYREAGVRKGWGRLLKRPQCHSPRAASPTLPGSGHSTRRAPQAKLLREQGMGMPCTGFSQETLFSWNFGPLLTRRVSQVLPPSPSSSFPSAEQLPFRRIVY